MLQLELFGGSFSSFLFASSQIIVPPALCRWVYMTGRPLRAFTGTSSAPLHARKPSDHECLPSGSSQRPSQAPPGLQQFGFAELCWTHLAHVASSGCAASPDSDGHLYSGCSHRCDRPVSRSIRGCCSGEYGRKPDPLHSTRDLDSRTTESARAWLQSSNNVQVELAPLESAKRWPTHHEPGASAHMRLQSSSVAFAGVRRANERSKSESEVRMQRLAGWSAWAGAGSRGAPRASATPPSTMAAKARRCPANQKRQLSHRDATRGTPLEA